MTLIMTAPNTDMMMDVENEEEDKDLQIVIHNSHFKLPDDWLVEHKPRPSNPNHVDRYYIEPHTGHKFRSLVSVQRHLNGETRDYLPINRTISENKGTIVIRSHGKLPDDWLVEHRPRVSNPKYTDKYYIEPHTGQKFRSLVSVQRYLNEETRDYLPTERMISENKNSTFTKSRTAQKLLCPRDFEARKVLSAKDFEGHLTGENPCKATPKHSENNDSQKKMKTGEDNRGPIHNLTRPPTKVSWVLSGPGGFWNPFVDDSIVQASEKRKWSEAFSISINEGVNNY